MICLACVSVFMYKWYTCCNGSVVCVGSRRIELLLCWGYHHREPNRIEVSLASLPHCMPLPLSLSLARMADREAFGVLSSVTIQHSITHVHRMVHTNRNDSNRPHNGVLP